MGVRLLFFLSESVRQVSVPVFGLRSKDTIIFLKYNKVSRNFR